ncbi:multidrug resistance protein [Marivirga tractuosa]|uniref:Acriflavin resistance protein n=1 Tax=Marivirga tractuosa (strain ATCC 23168 / DSM 4126 / NBRC 15989 / NCIMB 1408 / VKM B-1430 / H-43) TaxID=643867 RepID=E4TSS4_MARTH|nr:efflux RND transporter permease subunit [Marivirga tractuosa]ADR21884.1 acriflavin resistance protein [Marivirga tractuosa DSM 4126]BDD13658.1 multidrug resistance protein [Marivirga tractuosa]
MASLSEVSIQRPVLAIVLSLVILIFGFIGFNFLGVREYPSVDPPIITVTTDYAGANADVVESQITEPLEEAVNGIAGIRTITSTSAEGRSRITIEFNLSEDLEAAANDVRDKVSGARRRLPEDAEPPTVNKADADSDPIVFLNINSEQRSLLELSAIAENTFKERLQTISGVSEVRIWGEKRYAMRLWMDPIKLAAYQLTPLDVLNAVESQNVELPSGSIEGDMIELVVKTQGQLSTEKEFNDLIIAESNNSFVRFSDIGYAELGPLNMRTVLKRDGIPMVGVVLIPQPGSNSIDIVDEFYKRVDNIKKDLPEDINLGIGFDQTEYIRESINEVQQTIIIAFLLVILIIFAFLRDWRTTVIPIATIPVALIGTFFVMYLAGFSINVLTLLGIVLAIGLVVDDAIVVLENIYTKVEDGMEPMEAAKKGAVEIFFAVIATTVALVAVFMPVIFLEGITGRLFREFGVVVATAVMISSFVALSLTPMMSSRILKRRERHNWFYRKTEPFFVWLNKGYARSLDGFMKVRWMGILLFLGAVGLIYGLFKTLPSELAPLEDRGMISVSTTGPEGATFEYMGEYIDNLVEVTMDTLPTDGLISVTSPGFGTQGTNSGFMRIMLVDASEREKSQQQLYDEYTPILNEFPAAKAFAFQQQTIGGRRGGLPIQYVIQATSLDKLQAVLPAFIEKASNNPTFTIVDQDLKFTKPQIDIQIDREKARSLGISVIDVARTLQLGLSGQRFDYFIMDGKQYQVIGQVQRNDRNAPVDLRSLYVRAENGQMLQLDNLVTLGESSTPPSLYRYNRYISATLSAGLAPGKTIGDGVEAMDAIAAEVLDETYSTSLSGASLDYFESSSSLLFAFGFAIILIYLVLAAQFESFRDPVIILFTVPLAVGGSFLSLWLFGETLNIFSQIGIIMLIGLVSKNAILIVEFANQKKAQGLSLNESITEAAKSRFRPILMTALSTILGILPIALALGAGSESRVSMGIAIIGGLIFATGLTLYVIPAIYSFFASKHARVSRVES